MGFCLLPHLVLITLFLRIHETWTDVVKATCTPLSLQKYCSCTASEFDPYSCQTPNGSFQLQYFVRPELLVLLDAPAQNGSHNGVIDIPADLLGAIPTASRLRVMLSNISSLPDELLSGFNDGSSWNVLELLSPSLKVLPENLFTRTKFLDIVMLKGSNVKALPKRAPCNAANFMFVESQLLRIPPGFFDCSVRLRNLDLYENQLSALPDRVFHQNRQLKTISLRNNKLNALPASLFSKCLVLEDVDLSNNFIESLPQDIFPPINSTVRFLFLQRNNLTAVSNKVFSQLNTLEELDLSFNKLETLPEGLLGSCQKLRLLNLEANTLRTIEVSLIINCSLLRVLNLRQNSLMSLPDEMLGECSHLSSLSLDYNYIRTLPDNLLHSCKQLLHLSISHNNLYLLDADLLHYSPLLSYVTFSGNNIEKIPNNFTINLVHLQELDLSSNVMNSVSMLHLADTASHCNLSGNALAVLSMNMFRWTSLHSTLDVSHNLISKFAIGWTAGLDKLLVLDLSYNKLTHIGARDLSLLTGLQTLKLNNNQITQIESETFYANYQLQYLDLSANSLLDPVNLLPMLPSSLQILNISGNQLTELYLEWTNAIVDARGNPIQLNKYLAYIMNPVFKTDHLLINNGTLECGKRLHITTASSNMPDGCSIPTSCPPSCRCSKGAGEVVIDCRNAGLVAVPDVKQNDVTALYLEGNRVKTIVQDLSKTGWKTIQHLYLRLALDSSSLAATDSLPDLLHLKLLDLSQNGLSHPLLPRTLPALQMLNLSHNFLKSIPSGIFSQAAALKILDLSYCNIQSLNTDSFRGLEALQELVLSNNQLNSWNKVWDSLPALARLHLNGNALTNIPLNTFVGATALQFLDLHGNSLNLDELFHQPSSLIAIDLSNTSFRGWFSDKQLSSNLTYISLKYNKITDVKIGERSTDNSSILVVDLTQNSVKHVHLQQQLNTEGNAFVQVLLGNNPLLCDCSITSLLPSTQHFSTEQVTLHVKDGYCKQPFFLSGKLLTSLSPDKLLCKTKNCPPLCDCYLLPTGGTIVDCSGSRNITQIPDLNPNQSCTELYLDNVGTVESLNGLSLPSWHNLSALHLTSCCKNIEDLNTTVLHLLHRLQHLDLNEKCWCRNADFIASNPLGIIGSCELSLPSPHCIRQPNSSHWKFVHCSSTFDPPKNLRVPACFVHEQCSECECYFDLHNTLVMNCSYHNLTALPKQAPPGIQVLDMDGNGLRVLHGLDFPHWQTLEELFVRNNELKDVDDENLPIGLSRVALEGNKLQQPTGWLLKILKGEIVNRQVWLSQNSWTCDCNVLPLTYVEDLSSVIADAKQAYCTNGDSVGQDLLVEAMVNCSKKAAHDAWFALIVGLAVGLGLVAIFAVITALWFRHSRAVRLWLFEHHFCIMEEDVDDDKDYDAFVAYSSEDGDFVANHLLPGLEDVDEPRFRYRLCIHERDWLGGELITEQIVRSIQGSRRTILVLTENFAASSWSILEFRTALQQALEDRVNRLIVVVPELVPASETLQPDLRLFVAMNTYLMFSDPKFWEKLRYAMPHRDRGFRSKGPERRMPDDFVELMNATSELTKSVNGNSEKSLLNA